MYYTEQQPEEEDVRAAFCLASSSSACAPHIGAAAGVRNTLSLFLSSFSSSIASLRLMMADNNESKRWSIPVKGVRRRVSIAAQSHKAYPNLVI